MKLRFERLGHRWPVPILVLDRLPGRLLGLSLGVAVVLRRDHAFDRATLVHELEHCKQFWRGGLIVHGLRYLMSRRYRLRAELEAFGAELQACPHALLAQRLDEAARALASGYRIGCSAPECKALLTAHLAALRQTTARMTTAG